MKRDRSALVWGIALVVLGVLFLLQTQGLLEGMGDLLWAGIFAAVGVGFTVLFVMRSAGWWPIIPGLTLLGLGALVGLSSVSERLGEVAGAPLFMGAIGAAFWTVYATERRHWWAIIPGGVMVSLAVMILLDALIEADVAWVLLLGIALTFVVVSLQRNEKGERFSWALIPAGVLGLVALGLAAEAIPTVGRLWPLALVAVGGALVWRAFRGKPTGG